MSIEALRWALEVGMELGLEPPRRHILLILGNRADERGYLYPSNAWIAMRTGLSRRTVQDHMTALGKAGLLRRDMRPDGQGGRTSDHIYLAIKQPGLPFEELMFSPPPRAESAPPPPVQQAHHPRAPAAPKKQEEKKELKLTSGPAEPTPVARCWNAYQAGMKKRYGTELPNSAKANGMLRGLVSSFGADNAVAMVEAYVASDDPWHKKVSHDLGILIRDTTKIFITVQQRTGAAIKPGTMARISLGYADGAVNYLTEYPLDDAERLARKCLDAYGRKIAGQKPKNIVVVSGTQRHVFSIDELRARA